MTIIILWESYIDSANQHPEGLNYTYLVITHLIYYTELPSNKKKIPALGSRLALIKFALFSFQTTQMRNIQNTQFSNYSN